MDRSNTCVLISKTYTLDALNQQIASLTTREVFCNIQSVTQSEWFNGGQQGLKPEYKVTMFAPDYEGEEIVSLNGTQYSVYRTYLRQDENIELYLEKRTGI